MNPVLQEDLGQRKGEGADSLCEIIRSQLSDEVGVTQGCELTRGLIGHVGN